MPRAAHHLCHTQIGSNRHTHTILPEVPSQSKIIEPRLTKHSSLPDSRLKGENLLCRPTPITVNSHSFLAVYAPISGTDSGKESTERAREKKNRPRSFGTCLGRHREISFCTLCARRGRCADCSPSKKPHPLWSLVQHKALI